MDWNVISTIFSILCGGSGIVSVISLFLYRKSEKRRQDALADHEQAQADHEQATANLEKFHGWEVQIERMNNQIEVKDQRIAKLNQQLAEKEERFQRQMDEYRDQTKRLREAQDREYEANAEVKRLSSRVTELTNENGDLRLELKDKKCHHTYCLDREPRNENTRKALADAKLGKSTTKLLEVTILNEDNDEDNEETACV